MRIKLDENVDARVASVFHQAGYDATTVREQGLRGAADPALYDHCIRAGCLLVTPDLDFPNVLRYPPDQTPGLVVPRGPNDLFPTVRTPIRTLVDALTTESPTGHLWIVEPGRIRIHEPNSESES